MALRLPARLTSMRARLLGVVAVALAIPVGAAVHRLDSDLSRDLAATHTLADRLAEEGARRQAEVIRESQALLGALARIPAVGNVEPHGGEDCRSIVAPIIEHHRWSTGVWVADAAGTVLCDDAGPPNGLSLADREYFQRAVQTKAPLLSGYLVGKRSGRSIMMAVRPILKQGRVHRVVGVSIDLASVADILKLSQHENSVVLVIDSGGTLLVRQPDPQRLVGLNVSGYGFVQRAQSGTAPATFEARGLDGRDRVWSHRPIEGTENTVIVGLPKDAAVSTAQNRFTHGLAALLGGALAGFAAIWAVVHFCILRWNQRLVEAAERIGAGSRSAGLDGADAPREIAVVAHALDRMADRLHARERALRQAMTDAEAALRSKEEFLATMSHEVRTPLNGVVGFTDLLLASPLNSEQRRWANGACDASRSLLTVVNDLLDLASMEAGKLTLNAAPFSLDEALASCEALMRLEAERKGLDLRTIVTPAATGCVLGDAARVRQVLLNLMSNAVKFTDHGSVVVTVTRDGETCRFSVADTGVGIAEERRAELFQRFSRIERRRGGTGLGLAISRHLADLMGGAIGVDSRPGAGSTFWLDIPLPPADACPVSPETVGRIAQAARRARVLVVDDQPMNRDLAVALLNNAGHEATTASDGETAVRLASTGGVDLILMDVQMPDLDGLETTRRIRALPDVPRVPILALTATTDAAAAQCIAAGMDGHLGKPIDRDALLAAIDRWAVARTGTAAAHAADEPVFDTDAVAALQDELGTDGLNEVVDACIEDLAPRLDRLSVAGADRRLLAFEAHALLSLSGSVGLRQLATLTRRLSAAANGDTGEPELLALADRVLAAGNVGLLALRGMRAGTTPG